MNHNEQVFSRGAFLTIATTTEQEDQFSEQVSLNPPNS